jgi:hypothetical protein
VWLHSTRAQNCLESLQRWVIHYHPKVKKQNVHYQSYCFSGLGFKMQWRFFACTFMQLDFFTRNTINESWHNWLLKLNFINTTKEEGTYCERKIHKVTAQ